MKKVWIWALLVALLCGAESANAEARRFAIVVKNMENPYMHCMYEGFSEACGELGAEVVLAGPGEDGTPDQSQSLQALIDDGVDAIAVAANDKQVLSEALSKALELGIAVISLDATVNPDDRMLHIQQASPEIVGRVLIQAGAVMMEQQGQFAILSTTANTPNQQSWVNWMKLELSGRPEKYGHMELVEIAYGLDQYETSEQLTRSLLERYPELKLIIAPTAVGIHAAASVIEEQQSKVKLTGLGLPSEMELFIEHGTCPWMYLWNPSDLGYLAAYALDALADGRMTGAEGELLNAGKLGGRAVVQSEDGGTELVLGNPKMFDSTNIMLWKELF